MPESFPRLDPEPTELARRIVERSGTTLIWGESSWPKSDLIASIADALEAAGAGANVVSAEPSLPPFGPPGAVSMGRRRGGSWHVDGIEALCTLDAGRFRLPLVVAVERLAGASAASPVLVVAPAVSRGMAGAELVTGLLEVLSARTILCLTDGGNGVSWPNELSSGPWSVFEIRVAREPRSARSRALSRTALWDRHLEEATEKTLRLTELALLGAAPPPEAPDAWPGRQVAVLDREGNTVVMGEARRLSADRLDIVAPGFSHDRAASVLVRDARRGADGLLSTDRAPRPGVSAEPSSLADLTAGSAADSPLVPPVTSLASAKALLVNGIFGDPLLHIRFRHRKRSLLFDLGETGRLPARIVHQVSDVFITHAHFDHIGGFLWFLRSCIGSPEPRRIFGPPGLADHVEGMIGGIHWDRIGDRGPVFEIAELNRARLERFRLRVGQPGREPLGARTIADGVLLEEPGFRVRTEILDHGIPVLAFALEESQAFRIRKDRLRESGWEPGRWLSELKQHLHAGSRDAVVELPDGTRRGVDELASRLVLTQPGDTLVYATDLADTEDNRRALVELARDARVFYCEASFVEAHRNLARSTQHLTARACGEIAQRARVVKLVPFHFSKRYEREPERVYAEVKGAFDRIIMARSGTRPKEED